MKKKIGITECMITNHLRRRHQEPEWVCLSQFRPGTGYGHNSERWIDVWVLNCYPSKQNVAISYEIKVSRADWLQELKNPKKRRLALNFSNEFYFIAPNGVIKEEEVPIECGYIQVNIVPHELPVLLGGIYDVILGQRKIVSALWRDRNPPTWRFVAGVIRAANKGKPDVGGTEVESDIELQ